MQEQTYLGTLDAERDWGHARDYVEGMWRMLRQETPDDYVLATGRTTTVRRFCEMAFSAAGIELAWEGVDEDEKGYDADTGRRVVEVDPRYYRPTEVHQLLGGRKGAEGARTGFLDEPGGDGPRDGDPRPGRGPRRRSTASIVILRVEYAISKFPNCGTSFRA